MTDALSNFIDDLILEDRRAFAAICEADESFPVDPEYRARISARNKAWKAKVNAWKQADPDWQAWQAQAGARKQAEPAQQDQKAQNRKDQDAEKPFKPIKAWKEWPARYGAAYNYVYLLNIKTNRGEQVNASFVWPKIYDEVEKVCDVFKSEDRIRWAMRFVSKGFLTEMMWHRDRAGSKEHSAIGKDMAPDQPGLGELESTTKDVDLSPFTGQAGSNEPPVTGFGVIDSLLPIFEYYADIDAKYGREKDSDQNVIRTLAFGQRSFSEVVSLFRQEDIKLREKWATVWKGKDVTPAPSKDFTGPVRGECEFLDSEVEYSGDLKNKSHTGVRPGYIEKILDVDEGMAWFDLHRPASLLHGEMTIGHCAQFYKYDERNTKYKNDVLLELASRVERQEENGEVTVVWKPLVTFEFHRNTGTLHEMVSFKNNPPSYRYYDAIFQLLLNYKPIKGITGLPGSRNSNNFHLKELPTDLRKQLKAARPELWVNSDQDQIRGDLTREVSKRNVTTSFEPVELEPGDCANMDMETLRNLSSNLADNLADNAPGNKAMVAACEKAMNKLRRKAPKKASAAAAADAADAAE